MTKREWRTDETPFDFAERVLAAHSNPNEFGDFCAYCDRHWPCEPRRLAEIVIRHSSWKPFDESDKSTYPDENLTYATIDNEDMMQIHAGRLNYFNRAKVVYYIALPSFPEETLDAE